MCFFAISAKRYSPTIATFPVVPHPMKYVPKASWIAFAALRITSGSWLMARVRVSFCSMISLIRKCGCSPFSAVSG